MNKFNLEIEGIDVIPKEGRFIVRINIGGEMYFDTPVMGKSNAICTHINLMQRMALVG